MNRGGASTLDSESTERQFELHLARGIAYLVGLKLSGIEELVGLALVDRSAKSQIKTKLPLPPVTNKVTTEATEPSRCKLESEQTQPKLNSIKLVWQETQKVTTGKSKKRISKKL